MSIESDQKLILQTADKLLVHSCKLTKMDADVAVAALGVAMMCLAKATGTPRLDIDVLLNMAERELEDSDCQHKWNEDEDGIEVCALCGEERGEDR